MSEEQSTYSANPGKQLVRTVDGVDYQRIPVKTHLITNTDDMAGRGGPLRQDRMQEGDILFISEKAVACTQNRAIPMEDIKPRKLAVTLSPLRDQDPRRHRSGYPRDHGDGPAGVRHSPHPLRRLLQCDRQDSAPEAGSTLWPVPRPGVSTVPPRAPSLPMTTMWS